MPKRRLKMCYCNLGFAIVFAITAIVSAQIVSYRGKQQPKSVWTDNSEQINLLEPNNNEPNRPEPNRPKNTTKVKPAQTKPTLNEVASRARGWQPAYMNWYGKPAPDFTVTDIKGQKHTLSEYRGRNVMITFWATWCVPCIQEIPHLIELRKTFSDDKLEILAISLVDPRNTPAAVKIFVKSYSERYSAINYTVISADSEAMSSPYNMVNSIPCSFFIDAQGRFKFATEGMIQLPQMKAIIEAEK
jgi:thiol-disulfide isomerase/thioredoxin